MLMFTWSEFKIVNKVECAAVNCHFKNFCNKFLQDVKSKQKSTDDDLENMQPLTAAENTQASSSVRSRRSSRSRTKRK